MHDLGGTRTGQSDCVVAEESSNTPGGRFPEEQSQYRVRIDDHRERRLWAAGSVHPESRRRRRGLELILR
jgi:hypothetical protein